jgi:hypothetical protein
MSPKGMRRSVCRVSDSSGQFGPLPLTDDQLAREGAAGWLAMVLSVAPWQKLEHRHLIASPTGLSDDGHFVKVKGVQKIFEGGFRILVRLIEDLLAAGLCQPVLQNKALHILYRGGLELSKPGNILGKDLRTGLVNALH